MKKLGWFVLTLLMLGILMPGFKTFSDSITNTSLFTTVQTSDNIVATLVIAALPWSIPLIFIVIGIVNLVKKDDDNPNIRNL